ncbi:spore coat protein GerQ [Virgibacillus siamensis]|uniref:spore coat protein GerQ n=1 Tax=Virgibacillus siamensis TaxID=480071 RepID=UPI000986F705|nr:spore coat protein GerQ [Virgibacillus siamensis]
MSNQDPNGNQPYNNPYQAYYPYYYYPQAAPAYYPAYDTRQMDQSQMQPPMQNPAAPAPEQAEPMLPTEQSYIENILRLNEGKIATVYMSFENNAEWSSKIFKGRVEAAGRDHIILSDPETGKRYLLLMIYLDYVTFDEEINYAYPYGNSGNMTTNPSR